MIQGTSAMDQPIAGKRFPVRRWLPWTLVTVVLIAGGLLLYPRVRGWMDADRSVELSRLRLGDVVRGDLERDLSVQGRIVAAFHPTALSPAGGIVALAVQAGEVVSAGQVLATVDSPELRSRLKQEQSTQQSLAADQDRQRILAAAAAWMKRLCAARCCRSESTRGRYRGQFLAARTRRGRGRSASRARGGRR